MKKNINSYLYRLIAIIVSILCCFTFLTGCKATPEEAPVVNKTEGVSDSMKAETLAEGDLKVVDTPQPWKESIMRQNDQIEIKADVDVKVPEGLSNTPVYQLHQIPLTEEYLSELIEYFAGENKLYKPLQLTKSECDEQLAKLQDDGLFGLFDAAQRNEMQKEIENIKSTAPENDSKEYMKAAFELPLETERDRVYRIGRGYEDTTPKTQDYLNVFVDTGEEYEPEIKATRFNADAGTKSGFQYKYPGDIYSESDFNALAGMFSFDASAYDESYAAYVEKEQKYLKEIGEKLEKYDVPSKETSQLAQKAIENLGINDLNLTNIEKGIWLPRSPKEWAELSVDVSQAKLGYYLTYSRSAGGLVGAVYNNYGNSSQADIPAEQLYAPPFLMESIKIFISDGEIILFDWQNMAEQTETIAENTNLLPWNDVTKQLANTLSYVFAIPDGEGGSDSSYNERIDILSAKLCSDYIPAKDQPDEVWIIPIWQFEVRATIQNMGEAEKVGAPVSFRLNALDGGLIVH